MSCNKNCTVVTSSLRFVQFCVKTKLKRVKISKNHNDANFQNKTSCVLRKCLCSGLGVPRAVYAEQLCHVLRTFKCTNL